MRLSLFVSAMAVLALLASSSAWADSIDGRVIQVRLPAEDVTLFYVEARNVFTVRLSTKSASVEGQAMYIGDGQVAIELVAYRSQGIILQGVKYRQGDKFKRGSRIKVRSGYKKASELRPGDVYVTLPGVTFTLPTE